MFTDGHSHFLKPIALSEVNAPLFISEIKLNYNKTLLIVKYSSQTNVN